VVAKKLTGTGLCLVLLVLGGCDSSPDAAIHGECSGRIRYQGVIYRPHNALNQAAPIGEPLGKGSIIGCGGLSATAVVEVRVFAVKGVKRMVAVATEDAHWHGVYIAEGVRQSSWPAVLRR
jgi:hypothetical protein